MNLTCDNCGFTAGYDKFHDARELSARISVGGVYTDKECPDCGALAYPVEHPKCRIDQSAVDRIIKRAFELGNSPALTHKMGVFDLASQLGSTPKERLAALLINAWDGKYDLIRAVQAALEVLDDSTELGETPDTRVIRMVAQVRDDTGDGLAFGRVVCTAKQEDAGKHVRAFIARMTSLDSWCMDAIPCPDFLAGTIQWHTTPLIDISEEPECEACKDKGYLVGVGEEAELQTCDACAHPVSDLAAAVLVAKAGKLKSCRTLVKL